MYGSSIFNHTFSLIKTLILVLLFSVNSHTQDLLPAKEALFKHKQKLWQQAISVDEDNPGYNPQNRYDAVYYKLELDIQFNPNLLTGKVTGRFKSKVSNLDTLVLDLDNAMSIISVSGPLASYKHNNQKIEIELSQAISLDEMVEITIEYSGIPDSGNDRWLVFDQLSDGSPHLWTLSEPYGAKYWWPCKDFPADKADSVDIIVTVPQDQLVASNGTLQSDAIENGKRTFHWQEKYPIATYLVSLAIAPYAHFTDSYTFPDSSSMLLDYYVYPQFEETARAIFPNVKDHLDALSYYFGPYPFSEEKYGMAQFGWGGAMEHQTISSIGRVGANWEYVYVHELGHQWFGDALTCASWTDIWLNEGFASYSEALYAEWAGFQGLPPGLESYKSYMGRQKYFGDGTLTISDTSLVTNIFDRIVYDKGSWVLHMLRHILGDDAFFRSLKTYATELQFTSVRTVDFVNICEEISGKELNSFFDQWLNYPFYPRYAFSWEQTGSEQDISVIQVTIVQEQPFPIYEMPVDMQFIFPSGRDTLIQVINNQQEQSYLVELEEIPLTVKLDPDGWILKTVQNESGGSYSSDIQIENIYPNPSNSEVTIIARYWGQGGFELQIFDYLGREVKKLSPFYATSIHKYYYKWDGMDENGNKVAAGIYLVSPVLKNKTTLKARKIVIMK